MQRYKLTIAYDGRGFHGWQSQKAPAPTGPRKGQMLRTVQGVFDHVLPRLLKQPVQIVGASRTDSGVHALGQVAHFDADTPIPVHRLGQALNNRLPEDIEVREIREVGPAFHAILGAVTKQYRFRIWNAQRRPLTQRHLLYHGWVDLNEAAMADAAGRLVGEHDFAGFAAAGHGRTTTVRTIHRCVVERAGEEVVITVEGSGFLYNMVRIIAGTLFEVGRGRFGPEVIDRVLETTDRREAGPTLPPQGLCLHWIRYADLDV